MDTRPDADLPYYQASTGDFVDAAAEYYTAPWENVGGSDGDSDAGSVGGGLSDEARHFSTDTEGEGEDLTGGGGLVQSDNEDAGGAPAARPPRRPVTTSSSRRRNGRASSSAAGPSAPEAPPTRLPVQQAGDIAPQECFLCIYDEAYIEDSDAQYIVGVIRRELYNPKEGEEFEATCKRVHYLYSRMVASTMDTPTEWPIEQIIAHVVLHAPRPATVLQFHVGKLIELSLSLERTMFNMETNRINLKVVTMFYRNQRVFWQLCDELPENACVSMSVSETTIRQEYACDRLPGFGLDEWDEDTAYVYQSRIPLSSAIRLYKQMCTPRGTDARDGCFMCMNMHRARGKAREKIVALRKVMYDCPPLQTIDVTSCKTYNLFQKIVGSEYRWTKEQIVAHLLLHETTRQNAKHHALQSLMQVMLQVTNELRNPEDHTINEAVHKIYLQLLGLFKTAYKRVKTR